MFESVLEVTQYALLLNTLLYAVAELEV